MVCGGGWGGSHTVFSPHMALLAVLIEAALGGTHVPHSVCAVVMVRGVRRQQVQGTRGAARGCYTAFATLTWAQAFSGSPAITARHCAACRHACVARSPLPGHARCPGHACDTLQRRPVCDCYSPLPLQVVLLLGCVWCCICWVEVPRLK